MTTSQTFALDLKKACDKAKGQTELVARKVMLDLFSRVIMKSPVDTGRFRANWNVAYGSPDTSTTEAKDKSGSASVGKMQKQVISAPMGGSVFLTNSLPYSMRLEYDSWSKQAPAGMVRLSLVEITNQYGA